MILVREEVMHDMSIRPHMHSKEAVDRLFPLVLAAGDIEDTSEKVLGEPGQNGGFGVSNRG